MNIELVLPSAPPPDDLEGLRKYVYDLAGVIGNQLVLIMAAVNGQLTFGDGTDSDNIPGSGRLQPLMRLLELNSPLHITSE